MKYYVVKVERLVIEKLNESIGNPKRMGKYIEAYIAERRAQSAAATKNKAKLTTRLTACKREMDRLIDAVQTGVFEAHEVASKISANREEMTRIQTEIATAQQSIAAVDLHPAAVARFKRHFEQLSATGGEAPDDATRESIRGLIDSVIIIPRRAGEPYKVEVRGRLSALLAQPHCRLNSVIPSAGTTPLTGKSQPARHPPRPIGRVLSSAGRNQSSRAALRINRVVPAVLPAPAAGFENPVALSAGFSYEPFPRPTDIQILGDFRAQ